MKDFTKVLKAVADENRLKIICLLLEYDYCVSALAKRIGISEAAVSQQLQILRRAGLVKGEKRGYWTHYAVEKKVIGELANDLKALLSQHSSVKKVCSQSFASKQKHRGKTMCQCTRHEELKKQRGEDFIR